MNLNNKIKEYNDLLIHTGLFKIHSSQKHLSNIDSAPHHLSCIDGRVVLYLDHKYPDYYPERGIKISTMDWSRKCRPQISFEEFYEITTDEVKSMLLFYSDLFMRNQ
jgi:hypothetical protein